MARIIIEKQVQTPKFEIRDEFKKTNCLTCKFSDTNNNGKTCSINRMEKCIGNRNQYQPVNKILHLNLKKDWFDKIQSGEKTVEFREYKKHYKSLFKYPKNNQLQFVKFKNGYAADAPSMIFEIKCISIWHDLPNDLNMPVVYAIELGRQVTGCLKNYSAPVCSDCEFERHCVASERAFSEQMGWM